MELVLGAPPGEVETVSRPAGERVRELVDGHHDFVWRSLRRLGVPAADVDDAVQKVFLTLSRKLDLVRPGCERSYLFQTALRVASDNRRSRRRRREVGMPEEDRSIDPSPPAEEVVDKRRARELLDALLDELPIELRAVFVLFELEELTMVQIAEILEIPLGTVASRLRRARLEFRTRANRAALRRGGFP